VTDDDAALKKARADATRARGDARRARAAQRAAEARADDMRDIAVTAERERTDAATRARMLQSEKDRAWEPLRRQRPPRQIDVPLLLAAVPGMAAQFDTEVPASAIDGHAVTCTCGARTDLNGVPLAECTGACGRHFLRAGTRVWRARYGP